MSWWNFDCICSIGVCGKCGVSQQEILQKISLLKDEIKKDLTDFCHASIVGSQGSRYLPGRLCDSIFMLLLSEKQLLPTQLASPTSQPTERVCLLRPPVWFTLFVFNTMFTLSSGFVNEGVLPQQRQFRVLKGAQVSGRSLPWLFASGCLWSYCSTSEGPGRRRRREEGCSCSGHTLWTNVEKWSVLPVCFTVGFLTCCKECLACGWRVATGALLRSSGLGDD